MAPDTGWYRTESGVVLEMDHPLPGGIAHRVRNGEIVRVANAAGDPWEPPAELPTPSSDEVAVTLAETRAELAKTLDRVAELEAERDTLAEQLRAAETERDQARAELDQAKTETPPAPPVKATKAAAAKAETK